MRIVYVEDNQANVFLVKRVARMGGHDIINYIDGEEALSNINRDQPNLILMDIQLAGEMSGLQVVEKLREDGFAKPIIAVTAYAMVGDRERCLSAGCNDYIAKPLSIPLLIELMDYYNGKAAPAADKPVPAEDEAIPDIPTPAPAPLHAATGVNGASAHTTTTPASPAPASHTTPEPKITVHLPTTSKPTPEQTPPVATTPPAASETAPVVTPAADITDADIEDGDTVIGPAAPADQVPETVTEADTRVTTAPIATKPEDTQKSDDEADVETKILPALGRRPEATPTTTETTPSESDGAASRADTSPTSASAPEKRPADSGSGNGNGNGGGSVTSREVSGSFTKS